MSNKKVLIITYYWPPAGGPGVQRWLKFVKYLPEFGVEPIVYTPENPSYPIVDPTLATEVDSNVLQLKTKIWEPYQIAEKLNPKNKEFKAGQFTDNSKQGFLSKLSVFIRGNFFIPDARKFWVKPSVKFLAKYIQENQIETIITSGPPHSLHLIGLNLKKQFADLKWIADFRDPWTQISYHSQLRLTKLSKLKHQKLEHLVITSADVVLATSYTDGENFRKIGAKRVEVITNGFDQVNWVESNVTTKFQMTYSGGLEMARNPEVVWKALSELKVEVDHFADNFEFHFVGNLSPDVKNSMINHNLTSNLVEHGYVNHDQSLQMILQSSMLLLTNFPSDRSKGIIPGKLFEYLQVRKPILAIGPKDGDVKRIIDETNSGQYFSHDDLLNVKRYILENFLQWKCGEISSKSSDIDKFSRKRLTEKLVQIINTI